MPSSTPPPWLSDIRCKVAKLIREQNCLPIFQDRIREWSELKTAIAKLDVTNAHFEALAIGQLPAKFIQGQ